MRTLLTAICLIFCMIRPVSALELTAPTVPEAGQAMMPERSDNFSEGLWELMKGAVGAIHPDIREAAGLCVKTFAIVLLCSISHSLPGSPGDTCDLVGSVTIGMILLQSTRSLILLGTETVTQISEYGKLLLPVMTAAMAAQGGVTASAALYAGTAMFNSLLTALISGLLVPCVYFILALSLGHAAISNEMLGKLRDMVKSFLVWSLKTILYLFTGYMGITGAVSGSADAAALKATKLTISGVIPVVGGILADASEAVLVGARVVKNAAGVYGMLAILAICISPFFRIGIHYWLLKITAAMCAVTGSKRICKLIDDFTSAMGLILAMTGAVCLLELISTVCFLRGIG